MLLVREMTIACPEKLGHQLVTRRHDNNRPKYGNFTFQSSSTTMQFPLLSSLFRTELEDTGCTSRSFIFYTLI